MQNEQNGSRPPETFDACPVSLTPEEQAKIIQFLRLGNYLETAAALAGVTRSAVLAVFHQGALQMSGPSYQFLVAARRATAEAEATDLAIIQMAARKGDWRAASWRLERRFGARWGGSDELEPLVDMDPVGIVDPASMAAPASIESDELTDDDYAEAAELLVTRRRERKAAARARTRDQR
jgi:hypothetical protein